MGLPETEEEEEVGFAGIIIRQIEASIFQFFLRKASQGSGGGSGYRLIVKEEDGLDDLSVASQRRVQVMHVMERPRLSIQWRSFTTASGDCSRVPIIRARQLKGLWCPIHS